MSELGHGRIRTVALGMLCPCPQPKTTSQRKEEVGSDSVKQVNPLAEQTSTPPPCARTMDRVMASPSPELSVVRCRELSTR